jgi:hypothetical protein
MGVARLIDLPLNRLAGVGDGSLWSVTHNPAFSLLDRISCNANRRLQMLAAATFTRLVARIAAPQASNQVTCLGGKEQRHKSGCSFAAFRSDETAALNAEPKRDAISVETASNTNRPKH